MDKQSELDTVEKFGYISQELDVSKLDLDCDVSWLEEADAAAGQLLLDKIRYLVESGEAAGLKYVDGLIHLALSQLAVEGHDTELMHHFSFCLNCGVLFHSEYSTNSDPQRDFCKETCEEEWHNDNPGQPYEGELELLKVFKTEFADFAFQWNKKAVFVVATDEEAAMLWLKKEGANKELLESFVLEVVNYEEAVKIRRMVFRAPPHEGFFDHISLEYPEENGFFLETKTSEHLLDIFISAPAKMWIKKLGEAGVIGYFDYEGIIETKNVVSAIKKERLYQDKKHGTIAERPKSLAGWLLIMQHEFQEALTAWNKSHSNEESLKELLQVAAVGWACLEQYAPNKTYFLVGHCISAKVPDESYPLMLLKMKHKLEALESFIIGGDNEPDIIEKVVMATGWAIKTIERHGLFERPGVGE